ncbi:hydroxymethylpyrimidine kinase / phosphomethylpyrimidine kinase / thiamine-phosphate diphosphorylase [Alteromonadaceae bacterium Bs31]|nr:hydroxymethylpyrimidine kinase / phosphomethylpyrimidine kinase / thiamine-phosphate diphosphorylase [Alteromonadaceae bacterium Bs31]
MNRVWCIGGSDNSGGAGLQRDIATLSALACSAASILSCVTSQNHKGIKHLEPLSRDLFVSQLQTLEQMETPAVIKIGMLANGEQAALVQQYLPALRERNPDLKVICDPVCAASAGGQSPQHSIQHLQPLMAECDLVTPNITEAENILAGAITSVKDMENAARALWRLFDSSELATRVLLKGGHLAGSNKVTDIYFDGQNCIALASPSRVNISAHGTGCTLGSAIAAALAKGYILEDSIVIAKAYMQQALEQGYNINSREAEQSDHFYTPGLAGWPCCPSTMPEIISTEKSMSAFPEINREYFRFYPVVDSADWVERLLLEGVKTIQLRIKNHTASAAVEEEIIRAIALGDRFNAQVFINDYWQLAIKHRAFGVHLGQQDIQTAQTDALLNAGLRLGISTHGYMELIKAVAVKPSYIALGHIFPTQTKTMPSKPQGVERLRLYHQWASTVAPTVAIGGIKQHNLHSVLNTGVDAVAVVSAVTQAKNPSEAVSTFRENINAHFAQR